MTNAELQREVNELRAALQAIQDAVEAVPSGDVAAAWRAIGAVKFIAERALGSGQDQVHHD